MILPAPYSSRCICTARLFYFFICFSFFFQSCSVDDEEKTFETTDSANISSNDIHIYKGVFAAQGSNIRGTMEMILPGSYKDSDKFYQEATAKVTLHNGEIYKVPAQAILQKSSTADFKVRFESEDISFVFTLDENNIPTFSEVLYKDQMSAIVAAEHTADSPVTPITGTYKCINCENQTSSYNGIPLNNEERTFNMLLTTADGQTNLSIQALVGILVDTNVFANESCTTDDRFNICLIRSGETSSSEPLIWTGIHRYLKTPEDGMDCSDISGNFEFSSLQFGSIQGEFKSDSKCAGRTYYVSPAGDDSNTGISPLDSWKTISKVNTMDLKPGDAVLFEGNNTYEGSIYLDRNDANDKTNPVKISSYGTGRANISSGLSDGFMAYNTAGIVLDNLIFSGKATTTNKNSGIYFYNDLPGDVKLSSVKITNCEVYGFRDYGIVIGGWNGNSGFNDVLIENNKIHDILDAGISSYGYFSQTKIGYAHSNITVRSCEVYNIPGYKKEKSNHSGNGIVLSDVQHSVIEYSTAYNSGSGNAHSSGGPVGIWYWDADHVIIQYNEVYGMASGTNKDGGGFDLDGGVTNGIMQYNYSHDNEGAGYLIGQFTWARPMNNITVRYNISENDAATNGGSVYLFNGESVDKMKNIFVHNNTLVLTKPRYAGAANVKYSWKAINQNINFYNNIFVAENGSMLVDIPAGFDGKFFGNLYYTTGDFTVKYKGSIYNSLEAFRNTGNEVYQTLPVGYEGDPLLTDPGNGGTIGFGKNLITLGAYKLQEGSPALNNGVILPFDPGTSDFFGNKIEASSTIIGAHNSSSNSF